MSTYARPKVLVETNWLASQVIDPGLRWIEGNVRGGDPVDFNTLRQDPSMLMCRMCGLPVPGGQAM